MDAVEPKKIVIELGMPGRKARVIWAPVLVGALCFLTAGAQPAFARNVTLEDDSLRVAFDSRSGALVRLENKTTHWMVERRGELGVPFRLFAPLPDRNYNPVYGRKQGAAEVKKLSDRQIRLQWKNLASEYGGVLAMTLTSTVTLTNGGLVFTATLENDSPLPVDSIDYPYFGDLNPPTRHRALDMLVMRNGNRADLQKSEIYPHFGNEQGYWGVFYPIKSREANQSLFCLLQAPQEGLYVAVAVPKAPYRLQYTAELHPGVVSSENNLIPQGDEISGHPVHLEFRTCHFLFLQPHSTMELAPIVVRPYQGDSQAGVKFYNQVPTPAH
jgi:hypothetical protein